MFNPNASAETKTAARANLDKKFEWLTRDLGTKKFLMGDTFTVADTYLYTVLSWTAHTGVDLAKWHALTAYMARVGHRPKVQEALKAEGLIH